MKISKFTIVILLFLSPLCLLSQVSDYQMFREAGLASFKKGQYRRATFNFNVAKQSKDCPAKNDLQQWLKKSAKCEKLVAKGDQLYLAGSFSQAKSHYRKVVELNPDDRHCQDRIAEIKKDLNPPKDMILVDGGEFQMGNYNGEADEKPVHTVKLKSFYIDKYEVTNEEYCKFLNEMGNQTEEDALWIDIEDEDCGLMYKNGKYRPKPGLAKHPVLDVNWYGSRAYAKWAGKRLPTEAEWEFAARGGTKSQNYTYSGSSTASDVAWFDENSNESTHVVGSKKPNELGIYDMSGNVFEWCADWYTRDYYLHSAPENPQGPERGEHRIIRGGSWVEIDSQIHSTLRNYNPATTYNYAVGFRCVLDL